MTIKNRKERLSYIPKQKCEYARLMIRRFNIEVHNLISRSRINDLKFMTNEVFSNNLPQDLITKTGMDVVGAIQGAYIKQS